MKTPFSVLLLASVLCFGPALAVITIDNWSYAGAGDTDQEFWKDIPGSFCGDSSQSPINIDTKKTSDIGLAPFNLQSYDTTKPVTIENNGHALEVVLSNGAGEGQYDITGGGLNGTFRAVQFHFHFGSNDMKGSEHTVDGKRYPADMHIVHYDTAYGSVNEAIKKKGGIAVLGFFLEISNLLSILSLSDTHQEMENFTLSDLLPSSLDKFWRYDGSLTTPLCNEVVTWTLFEDTIEISNNQVIIGHKFHYERLRTPYKRFSDNENLGRWKNREIRTNLCDRSISDHD
ncbi:carbonic anhydrase 2-like [Strongylocentrotus purpuratus]|uniref:carbonic anhydrase n=1 Tax=Strongylocentrotus purpuratus TaxID=7668 RepID=A0A7M7N393_STRPU|nr:carbonic anhydrase 2-like [Strongylocentrotus purpuratus]